MTEEIKQSKEARRLMASSVPSDVPSYEALAKKEPNDILALWTETFPLDEEVKEG